VRSYSREHQNGATETICRTFLTHYRDAAVDDDPWREFLLALLITVEIGEINRFDKAEEVVNYAGLDPVVRESGDSRIENGVSKRVSGDLRWILVQCVQTAVHICDDP